VRARLTLAIVGVVAGALLVAGAGTLLLVRAAVARETLRTLAAEGRALATGVRGAASPRVLALVRRLAHLDHADLLILSPSGAVEVQGPPGTATPPGTLGLPPAALRPGDLLAGLEVVGVRGGVAFAAVPLQPSPLARRRAGIPPGDAAALLLEQKVRVPGNGTLYFLVTAGISLLVAAGVAAGIARRITRRLVHAADTAQRIARGDLDARVPSDALDDPEIGRLATSLNAMAEALARARHLERQFLLSISHDLRTPLTSIRGYAEAIADGAAADPAAAAAVVASEAVRLERLIQDLLDLARLDARRFSLDLRATDAAAVATSVAEGQRLALAQAGIALELDAPSALPPVRADPHRLAQVVGNLLDNAYKFARSRVRLTVGPLSEPPAGGVLLAVEDDGPGIAPEDLPHVFERLYTSSRRPARSAGSGLGLAIVAELVAAMGGTVVARSPAGASGGTRVEVRLAPWQAPEGAAATAPA
jgi:signal transduction histidine kinase